MLSNTWKNAECDECQQKLIQLRTVENQQDSKIGSDWLRLLLWPPGVSLLPHPFPQPISKMADFWLLQSESAASQPYSILDIVILSLWWWSLSELVVLQLKKNLPFSIHHFLFWTCPLYSRAPTLFQFNFQYKILREGRVSSAAAAIFCSLTCHRLASHFHPLITVSFFFGSPIFMRLRLRVCLNWSHSSSVSSHFLLIESTDGRVNVSVLLHLTCILLCVSFRPQRHPIGFAYYDPWIDLFPRWIDSLAKIIASHPVRIRPSLHCIRQQVSRDAFSSFILKMYH